MQAGSASKPASEVARMKSKEAKMKAKAQKLKLKEEQRARRVLMKQEEKRRKSEKKRLLQQQKLEARNLATRTKFRFLQDKSADSEAEICLNLSNYAHIRISCRERCSACQKAKTYFESSFRPALWKGSGGAQHTIYIDGRAYSNLTQAKRACLPDKGGVQDSLQPHQISFSDFFVSEMQKGKTDPFLLYWTVGSGKTEGSLAPFFRQPPARLVIVCYKSLVKYWQQKLMTFRIQSPTEINFVVEIVTFQTLQNKDVDLRGACVIIDEVQFYRNMTKGMQRSVETLRSAKKVLVLTATPLVNDARKEMVLWESLFGAGKESLKARVFYFSPRLFDPGKFAENYPAVKEFIVRAPMSWEQVFYYFYYESNKVSFANFHFQTPHRNYMSSKLRSACNSVMLPGGGLISSKLDALEEQMRADLGQMDRFYPKVIYSSNIETGVVAILDRISRLGLRVQSITGSTDMVTRNQIVNSYNNGELDVLVLSKVGNTGLNLVRTRSMDITSPHDNLESEKQTKGRVVRYESHKGVADPEVVIRKYVCTFPAINRPPVAPSDLFRGVLRDFFQDQLSFGNLVRDLQAKIISRKKTIEEKILENNERKSKEVDRLLRAFKQATIRFPGCEQMLHNEGL